MADKVRGLLGRARLPLFVLTALLLSACAPAQLPGEAWQETGTKLVWPEAPQRARISYLRSFAGRKDFADRQNSAAKMLEWLVGNDPSGVGLIEPYAVAADGLGRIWVADPGSQAIVAIDMNRRTSKAWQMVAGSPLLAPVGIAVDLRGDGRLYVSDANRKKVFILDLKGKTIGEIVPDQPFVRPAGLAVDAVGRLYVVDVGNDCVEVFLPDGSPYRTITGADQASGGFNSPVAVAVDRQERVYIVDGFHFRVEVQAADGTLLGYVGQLGDVPGTFSRPRGVAVDSEGHIYVSDAAFDNIQVFDLTGRLLLFWGRAGDLPGRFNLPANLFIDPSDRIYVADNQNQRVQVFQYLP